MEFTAWLENELAKRGWTPADLAHAAGLGNSTVTRILNGGRNPGPEFCRSVAKALAEPEETVFRQAGLLSPLPADENDLTLGALLDIVKRLPRDEREELLWYADARYKRWREEQSENTSGGTLPANAAP